MTTVRLGSSSAVRRPPTGATPSGTQTRARLRESIRFAEDITLADRRFRLSEFDSRATPASIVTKVAGPGALNLGALQYYGTVRNGRRAVGDFAALLQKQALVEGTPGTRIKPALLSIAADAFKHFTDGGFSRLISVEHAHQRDENKDLFIVMGQRKDRTWEVLSYSKTC